MQLPMTHTQRSREGCCAPFDVKQLVAVGIPACRAGSGLREIKPTLDAVDALLDTLDFLAVRSSRTVEAGHVRIDRGQALISHPQAGLKIGDAGLNPLLDVEH
jgi:hypothetical protein